jgi:hypothetical protein
VNGNELENLELEKLLSEKKDKVEQIQEKDTEYLQQINQLLHEKSNAHHCSEKLQLQKLCYETSVGRATARQYPVANHIERKKKNVVKPTMIERSSNTDTLETMSITPSISKAPYDPSKPSSSPDVLPLESCTMLWAVENKIVPHFDLHQLYELHPYFFYHGWVRI